MKGKNEEKSSPLDGEKIRIKIKKNFMSPFWINKQSGITKKIRSGIAKPVALPNEIFSAKLTTNKL